MMWHETTGVTLVSMILVKKMMVTRYVCKNEKKKKNEKIIQQIKSFQSINEIYNKFSTFLCLHIFIALFFIWSK